MKRSLFHPLLADLKLKMVLLSGPRQVGKTTVALDVLKHFAPHDATYLNWDRLEHRRAIRELSWSRTGRVVVLDEVHKYARWKTLIKGFHDTEGHLQKLLVTGSGRLDLYRRGGDSLAGRYYGLRLHPLSIGEILRDGGPPDTAALERPELWPKTRGAPEETLESLLELGGFPEPFLGGSSRQAARWRLARREQVLRQDVRDFTLIREVTLVEQLADMLAERVSAPLSINSLREDLQVDHKTVSSWIGVLERLQFVFRVPPYARSLARGIRKENKVYFWDWAEAPPGGPRLENLVAGHLLKFCHWMQDVEGRRVELCYVRDREKHEVDFLLLMDKKPWVLIEVKSGGGTREKSLAYFQQKLGAPHAFQLTGTGGPGRGIFPVVHLLAALP